MCGIAGIVSEQGFEPRDLIRMTGMIDYRGPDGFGFAFAGFGEQPFLEVIHNEEREPLKRNATVGLGNRRLAILDVSTAGSQPMQSKDGAYTITFNGEIYNFKELRQLLEGEGFSFRTGTDTEVILCAYQLWGEECLQRFNGMWAFALLDMRRKRLFCSRDRFGVKPFYYASCNGKFFFASEIKQILEVSGLARVANAETAVDFLEWGLLDCSERTFFEGIYQLRGGHCLSLDLAGPGEPVIRRYWDLQTEPVQPIRDQEAIEEFQDLFSSAVRLRLRSDVPLGISLSGGLDSSAVACQAKQLCSESPLQTFSACFTDPEIDERKYVSAAVSAIKGISHRSFPEAESFWKNLNKMTYHQDEPVGNPAVFAQWCVMAEARKQGVPVILGGQGGDESLCGYQKYQFFYWWHLCRQGNPQVLRECLMWLRQGTTSHWTVSAAARYLPGPLRNVLSVTERIGTKQIHKMAGSTRPALGSGKTLAERQKIDLLVTSIPTLLHHEDRTSMAHSVESRLPFMDYRVVEFLIRCPASLKLRDGWSKWVLRESLQGILPEEIRLRRSKLGFNIPEKQWMHTGLQNGLRSLREAPDLRMSRFIDPMKLSRECRETVERKSHALAPDLLFRAISLETWAQLFAVN
ncbi:MAG TPA: asparagine synthase (glutamine-hydrolyzing) [Candidatus Sulfotelmatobacter sp.]|nr:asparagine synthase (glutamine-hydrolyzing) [Candidatus Sulfotelmatobacter sp.]